MIKGTHKAPVISVEDSLRTRLRWSQERVEQLEEENRRLRGRLPGASFDDIMAAIRPAATGSENPAPSEEPPSAKQWDLRDLADRIDHEQLWRWSPLDRPKMTPEQCDRLDAGVALRRYADLWAPGRWVVFPPAGAVHFSASTVEMAFKMAKSHEARRSTHPTHQG
jgi:hypothetical protein